MAQATPALSSLILFSQYRGLLAFNMADGNPADPPPAADPPKDPPKDPPPSPDDETKRRISDLDAKNKEYKAKLKEYEDADRKRQEDEAKARGEHEKLAEQYKSESAQEKAAREAAENRLKAFEEAATKQVEAALAGITDAEKKKSAEALLEGLTPEVKMQRLPDVLKLVGAPAGYGQPTPAGTMTASKEQKQARFKELTDKQMQGKTLVGPEIAEKNRLMNELSQDWLPQV
jgi:hypothetical protein